MRLNDRGRPLDEPVDNGDPAASSLPGHRAGHSGQQPVHHRSVAEVAQRAHTSRQATQLAQQVNRRYDPRPAIGGGEILAAYRIETGDLLQLRGLTPDSAFSTVMERRRSGSLRHRAADRLDLDAVADAIGRSGRTLRRWKKSGLVPDAAGLDGTYSQAWASGLAAIIGDLGLGASRITARQRDQLRMRSHQLRDQLAATSEL